MICKVSSKVHYKIDLEEVPTNPLDIVTFVVFKFSINWFVQFKIPMGYFREQTWVWSFLTWKDMENRLNK